MIKKLLFCLIASLFFTAANAQDNTKKKLEFNPKSPVYELDATCGTCMFKMDGKGCMLAVKFKDKNYFVEGTDIDDHGDAHDKDGFCNAIKKAKVQGSVIGDKFLVTYFALIK
jgi:hypothetical protein